METWNSWLKIEKFNVWVNNIRFHKGPAYESERTKLEEENHYLTQQIKDLKSTLSWRSSCTISQGTSRRICVKDKYSYLGIVWTTEIGIYWWKVSSGNRVATVLIISAVHINFGTVIEKILHSYTKKYAWIIRLYNASCKLWLAILSERETK